MPQLNPTPWLMLLLFSWSVFLVFIPSKVMAHIFPNETVVKKKQEGGHIWSWPWL